MEFYKFYNTSLQKRFVPALTNKTLNALAYESCNITRSAITVTKNPFKSSVNFTLPKSHEFAIFLLNSPLEDNLQVAIYRETSLFWEGVLSSIKLLGSKIELNCLSSEFADSSSAQGARFSPQCWKNLYSSVCGVNSNTYKKTLTVASVNSEIISFPGLIAYEMVGGYALLDSQRRNIVYNSTNSITLEFAFTGTPSGLLEIFPGCRLTTDACSAFNNMENFGGFPYIPSINPMDKQGLI